MEQSESIVLLNDSFPPLIDGVANAVMNYASVIRAKGKNPIVLTPSFPEADDSAFPYQVLRYPSIDFRNKTGYMAGIPFSPEVIRQLEDKNVSLLHSHCPIVSTMMSREIRQVLDVPLILTYHTKFDIDIANVLKSKALQDIGKYALLQNINACDEVWAVSNGAVDNLRSLGFEGDCIVMHNGVDLPRGRVSQDVMQSATANYDLPANVPIFLFVGRIMWYKGLRMILDALAKLKADGTDYRMVFVGNGADLSDVQSYADSCGISDQCIFVGPVYDRDVLRAWYCRSDLFLFPSTFDTNGLVVREAAACSLGAVLIEGSCAAEGVSDGVNGLLIQETADSLYECIKKIAHNRNSMAEIGENACRDLYLSWQDAVETAMERYQIVIDRYRCGGYPKKWKPMEEIFRTNGELMDGLAHFLSVCDNIHENISAHNEHLSQKASQISSRLDQIAEDIRDIL